MTTCSNCQASFTDEHKYCPECGERLYDDEHTRITPSTQQPDKIVNRIEIPTDGSQPNFHEQSVEEELERLKDQVDTE